jgi:hypothetical protein
MMCPFRQKSGLDFMCNLHSVNTSMFFGQEQLGRRSGSGHITVHAVRYWSHYSACCPVVVTLPCMLPVSSLCLQIACLAAIMLPNIQHGGKIYFNFILMIT